MPDLIDAPDALNLKLSRAGIGPSQRVITDAAPPVRQRAPNRSATPAPARERVAEPPAVEARTEPLHPEPIATAARDEYDEVPQQERAMDKPRDPNQPLVAEAPPWVIVVPIVLAIGVVSTIVSAILMF